MFRRGEFETESLPRIVPGDPNFRERLAASPFPGEIDPCARADLSGEPLGFEEETQTVFPVRPYFREIAADDDIFGTVGIDADASAAGDETSPVKNDHIAEVSVPAPAFRPVVLFVELFEVAVGYQRGRGRLETEFSPAVQSQRHHV